MTKVRLLSVVSALLVVGTLPLLARGNAVTLRLRIDRPAPSSAITPALATDFELSVTTIADRTVAVQCVRGCKLVVWTLKPDGEFEWRVHPRWGFEKCQGRECSSGQVLGGVVTESPSPDFDLWVANRAEGTVIKCVRGCKFAAVAGSPAPDAPPPMRVQEIQFPCSPQTCASGRISGWVEPQSINHVAMYALDLAACGRPVDRIEQGAPGAFAALTNEELKGRLRAALTAMPQE